ncbi:MAG: helix-turn-helix domain-containing protein [Comamonadaceae bacterium]|nr:helix-turn-helix domain-containing protein [Comamonadaceae bacterium]
MKDLERQHILETLAAVGGSRKQAVERLGISERTLRYKLQQLPHGGSVTFGTQIARNVHRMDTLLRSWR